MTVRFSLGRLIHRTPRDEDAPVVRRADSHPDAPARRPIRASEEFGRPLPMMTPEPVSRRRSIAKREAVELPVDLETPLAALDPAAIPDMPREPVRPVAPLARPQIIDPGERFETFELTPVKRNGTITAASTVEFVRRSETPQSIGALLDRLERTAGRDTRPRASIEDTLGMLRSLATQ